MEVGNALVIDWPRIGDLRLTIDTLGVTGLFPDQDVAPHRQACQRPGIGSLLCSIS